jgi:hypothetical protein
MTDASSSAECVYPPDMRGGERQEPGYGGVYNRWIWRGTATAVALKRPVVVEKKALRIGEIQELWLDRPPVQGVPIGQASLLATAGRFKIRTPRRRTLTRLQPLPRAVDLPGGYVALDLAGSR